MDETSTGEEEENQGGIHIRNPTPTHEGREKCFILRKMVFAASHNPLLQPSQTVLANIANGIYCVTICVCAMANNLSYVTAWIMQQTPLSFPIATNKVSMFATF